jgi:ABC-type branched-subunit amino acid transport system substrate-binding protein
MKRAAAVAAAAVVATLAAACGGSSNGGGGGSSSTPSASGGGNSAPIKIGVLASITGSSASGFTPGTENGVKARIAVENAKGGVNGHKLTYVMADDASSPQGAAAGVKKLVQQDHVTAIVEDSAFFFGGFSVAVQAGVPVFGAGYDGGPEWLDQKNKNLFNVLGSEDYTKVPTTLGKITKALGVTKMGGLGYLEAPSAKLSVKAYDVSSKKAGIPTGYSTNIHFGSTDVGPAVLGIKNSKTDGFYLSTIPNTAFAVVGGLAQAGVKMKAILLATGYGGDLLQSKEATAAGEGAYFLTATAPIESGNAGAKAMQAGLAQYAGDAADNVPGFAETMGWLTTDAAIAAIGKGGANPTSSSMTDGFRNATWDGAGMWVQPLDFGKYGNLGAGGMGPGNCTNVVQLKSGKFVPVQGLSPVCGDLIPGLTITP